MYLFGIFTEIRVTGFQSHALSDSNQPIRMPHGSFHLNHFHPSRSVRHCYNLLGAIHPNSVMIRGKMASRHLGNGETGIGVSVLIPGDFLLVGEGGGEVGGARVNHFHIHAGVGAAVLISISVDVDVPDIDINSLDQHMIGLLESLCLTREWTSFVQCLINL